MAEVGREEDENKSEPVDVAAVMAEIRARVRADVDLNCDKQKPFQPLPADAAKARAGQMLHSEELRYLNVNYAYGPKLNLDSITSHRPGIIGRSIVRVKRKLLNLVWDLLKDYFTAEREFQASLVRYLNDLTKYIDARDAANFWELIRKLDYDITKALERIERIGDEHTATLRATERRLIDDLYRGLKEHQVMLTRLDAERAQQRSQLETVQSVASGLESIISRLHKNGGESGSAVEDGVGVEAREPTVSNEGITPPNYSYLLLENRFRGSEESIAQQLEGYLELFQPTDKPVLEIGPGRGELLTLFAARGIEALGVDCDAAMVESCRERGCNVHLADGISFLREAKPASFSGVIATQVVEHLTQQQLEELCRLCASRVAPGGTVVFETVNPLSLVALSAHYFRDPTHVWPLHPETLSYMMSLSGLRVVETRMLAPFSKEGQLRGIAVEEFMTPRWALAVDAINRNIEQLNSLLYGFQNYCVIASVSGE